MLSPGERKRPLTHRWVTGFPKMSFFIKRFPSMKVLNLACGFSVCHSFNKHCAPVGQALGFSANKTWSWPSGAHCLWT